jgi:hypothetical protein
MRGFSGVVFVEGAGGEKKRKSALSRVPRYQNTRKSFKGLKFGSQRVIFGGV